VTTKILDGSITLEILSTVFWIIVPLFTISRSCLGVFSVLLGQPLKLRILLPETSKELCLRLFHLLSPPGWILTAMATSRRGMELDAKRLAPTIASQR